MAFVEFHVQTILIAIIFYVANGKPMDQSGRVRRNSQAPEDWRNLLTEDVYNYHLNKGGNSNSLFESDIAGIDRTNRLQTTGAQNNAILDKNLRWKHGVVPYEISSSFASNEKSIIEEALQDIMRKTCVRFVPYAQQVDYISFVRRGLGCSSYVARTGGKQLIDLQPGCIYQIGEVQHEVMHALGFFHEQSRTDRDEYVTIIWSNVVAGAEDQFQTYRTDNLNMPYDYESIMHYGWNYFAKDAKNPTILPKVKAALGSRKVMSRWDVEKINRLYQCPTSNTPVQIAKTTTSARITRPTTDTPRPTTRNSATTNGHHVHYSTRPGLTNWEDFKKSVKNSRPHD